MTKCAAVAEGLVCVGYGDNNCCEKHRGCDAICFSLESGGIRAILVEIKKGRCDHKDVDEAVRQLEHCHGNIEVAKQSVDVEYVLVADKYTQNAIRRIERVASKRRMRIRRLRVDDSTSMLPRLVLRVAR